MKKTHKINNFLFYLFCTALILTALLGVSVIPFGNTKFSDELYLITSDRGYTAIKEFSPDSRESYLKAKENFNLEIAKLKALDPPFKLINLMIKNSDENDQKKIDKYISMYSDFYNGEYFKILDELTANMLKRNELSKSWKEKNTEYVRIQYVNDQTRILSKEMDDINEQLDLIDKEMSKLNIKANSVYSDFTKRIDTYIAKGIDINDK